MPSLGLLKVTRNSRFRAVKGSSWDPDDSPTYMYVVMVIPILDDARMRVEL